MKFLHPEFIYFMTLPLVILFGLLLTQKEASGTFFSDEVMERLRVAANTLTLKARNALFFLAGLFMIIALAEPVIPNGKITVAKKSADILIAMDISNSMLAKDVYPSRLATAKQKAIALIKQIKEDRVGVIAFASSAYLVSPLSFDTPAVAFLLQNLDTHSITMQGTNFLALLESVTKSSSKSKKKYVVILSDGGDQKDFSKEIAYAKQHHITVFVLAIGTKKGAPIELQNGELLSYKNKIVITKLNPAISNLALATGGVYVEMTNSKKDVEVLSKELSHIVAKKELKTKAIEKHIPLFYLPLGAAMILILIATSSMSKREEVKVESFVLFFLLSAILSTDVRAGVLDFLDLKEAKQAYTKKEYRKSARSFEAYAQSQNSPQAYYNAANAYYKAGDYHTAIGMYEKVHKAPASLRAKTYANLGNAYAKIGSYKKAIQAYKESLKINYDKEVEENKQKVEQLLRQKQHQQKQQNNNQQRKEQQKQNQQQNNQQSNNQQQNKDKHQNSKQNQQNDGSKKQNIQNDQQKKDKTQQQEQKTQQQGEKEKKKESKAMPKLEHKEKQMSDAEERKWLQYLNQDNKTFLYKMDTKQNFGENSDEKPW